MKKIFINITLILLLLILIEMSSFTFFTLMKDKFTFDSDEHYKLTQTMIEHVKKSYDAILGWKTIYDTKFGERPRDRAYPDDLLASFGDSFTHCDEVQYDETWQSYLSKIVERNVYNFGNPAYGTDQAYLRYTMDYPKVMTKITVLGLITENINRVANVYRPFYFPGTGIPAAKPYFILKENKMVLIENPVGTADEVNKLQDIAFLKKIGTDDYWYLHKSRPMLQFPYIKILLNRHFWEEVKLKLQHKTYNDLDPRSSEADLWENPKYERIMQCIFDKFVNDSQSYHTTPIIMISPMWKDAEYTFRNKKSNKNVTRIVSYCRSKGYLVFDGVDALIRNAPNKKELQSFYSGHLSPRGNQVIAKEFQAFLTSNRLL